MKTTKRAKYIKHNVKRKHHILDGLIPVLEEIAQIDGVEKVVPAKIAYSPKRTIVQPIIKFQRETISGFKLLVHSKGAIQEIFIIVQKDKKNIVRNKLNSNIIGEMKNDERKSGKEERI